MKVTVADVIQIMEAIAPISLAEDWDNVGLQAGEKGWPVEKIWIALDPTPEVVAVACENKVDLLITHHPLIFSPLKMVDFSDPLGNIIRLAGKHKMAIFSAHTNLDNARNGLNDILAKKIGLKDTKVLKQINSHTLYKLVVFVPLKYEKKILEVLAETNAGTTNLHTDSLFRHSEQGAFISRGNTKLSEKKSGKIIMAEEIRIETTVNKENLPEVIDRIRTLYPDEPISYDIYPLYVKETGNGAGRIGDLIESMNLSTFAAQLDKKTWIQSIKVAGHSDLSIDRVAVCSGSGSSLLNEFISSGAQVFVSGDLRYHDARFVEQAGLAAIDIGHFSSEFIVIDELEKRLQKILQDKKIDAIVEACNIERDPFWFPDN